MDSEKPQTVYVLVSDQNEDNKLNKTSCLSILSIIIGGAQAIGSVLLYIHQLGFLIGLTLFVIGVGRQMLYGMYKRRNNLVQIGYGQKIYGENRELKDCLTYLKDIFDNFNKFLIFASIVLLAIKGYNLKAQNNWNYFPRVCVPDGGCSRVSQAFNHRDDEVIKNNVFTVSGLSLQVIDNTLVDCLSVQKKGTIIYNEASYDQPLNKLSHTLFVSDVFGFVDDMYVEIVDCSKNKQLYSFNIQSALRLGEGDLGVNPRRVAAIYQCLADNIGDRYKVTKGKVC